MRARPAAAARHHSTSTVLAPASRRLASRRRASRRRASPGAAVAALQEMAGNRAVAELLQRHPIAAPDTRAERDAAAFAAGATRPTLSADRVAAGAAPASPLLGSHGRPLEPAVQRQFEQALGADLSSVRVHDDQPAHQLARRAGARATTLGAHVYFAAGRYAPSTTAGRELLGHELVHTLQPEARTMLHRTPEGEARLAAIERELGTFVISEERRRELEAERARLLGEGNRAAGPSGVRVIAMDVDDFEAQTGLSAARLPDAPSGLSGQEEPGRWPSAVPGAVGTASLRTPRPNWYYRVLQPTDPTLAQLLGSADIVPRPPDPGFAFTRAANPAEMTFRHVRPGGNVPQTGTDRISTASELEAFRTILAERGTGELARVDVDAARRLGAEFLERGDVMRHLEEIGAQIARELAKARAEGRGRSFLARLESRMRALEAAKAYARTFGEGQGVNRIPAGAITRVRGSSLGGAVAGEQALRAGIKAFRYGGRVLIVVGVAASVERIASAPEDQRARVATQEAGGWAFSLAAGEAGAGAGALVAGGLGIETGPGAVVFAVFGALVGGAIGFFGGQEAADRIYDVAEALPKAGQILADPAKLIETSQWMFGTPESRRAYYELRELETGEPSPFAGF